MNHPKAEDIAFKHQVLKNSYYESTDEETRWIKNTPYRDERVFESINKLKVFVPFERIITLDMGVSVCPYCNAKYMGTQPRCTNQIWWYLGARSYYSQWQRGDFAKGYQLKDGSKVESVKMTDCGSELKWDLQAEFDEQYSFFSFIDFISNLTTEGEAPLIEKYSELLGKEKALKYRLAHAEQRLTSLESRHNGLKSAVETIMNKMNSAGMNLTFGGNY